MNRWSANAKMAASLAAIFVMTAIPTAVSIRNLLSMKRMFDGSVNSTARKLRLAGDINIAEGYALAAERGVMLYTREGNLPAAEESKKLFADHVLLIDKDAAQLKLLATSDEERQAIDMVVRRNAAWRDVVEQVERLSSSGRVTEARNLELTDAMREYHDVDHASDRLEDLQLDSLNKDKINAARDFRFNLAASFALLALALSVSITALIEVHRLTATTRRERNFNQTVIDCMPGLFYLIDERGRFLRWNRNFETVSGYSAPEISRMSALDLFQEPDRSLVAERIQQVFSTGEAFVEASFCIKDRTQIPYLFTGTRLSLGNKSSLVGLGIDISERKRAETQLVRLARYDTLTGFANRTVFVESLDQAIARARRGEPFAVLYFDLDHFKDVNDTLGHPVGDLLLQAVARRLQASLRETDLVARFGGDEFAVILANIRDPLDAVGAVERILDATSIQQCASAVAAATDNILQALREPFSIQNNEIRSGATVGIAMAGPSSPNAETILAHADVALYRAKSEARGTYCFFDEAMDVEVRARVQLNTELREAIVGDQLFLVYQPQVDIETGRIVGQEALVRWRHPTQGVLGPGKFIPLAEMNGLILPLGKWVMRAVCRQIRKWLDAGIAVPVTAINLSGVQFKSASQLEDDIASSLAEFGVPAELLELELTESVLMKASHDHNDLLLRLRKTGHRIAIDDFGTGYSSLDYLRRHFADRIKIDQTFTADIGVSSGSGAIVKAALSLAHELGIDVLVEGVETAAQLELLRAWGCLTVQGYYFARPLQVVDLTPMLRIRKIAPGNMNMIEAAARTAS